MNKIAVVTGTSQGLGLETARLAVSKGYTVFALDINESEEIKKEDVTFLTCDISNYENVKEVAKIVGEKYGKVDVLVNCAGIWLDRARHRIDNPDFDFSMVTKQFNVNALGTLQMMREFTPLLLKSEKPALINVTSEAGSIAEAKRRGEYGYCMSKAAANMATKLYKNAYPDMRVYAIHPGWMKTPQGMAGATGEKTPQQDPKDSAKFIFDLAEGEMKEEIYVDVEGFFRKW